jgi:hypothetical protein
VLYMACMLCVVVGIRTWQGGSRCGPRRLRHCMLRVALCTVTRPLLLGPRSAGVL